jgi:hypothetical protein
MGLSINFFGCSVIIIVLSYKSSTNTIKYIKYESGIYDNSQNSLIYAKSWEILHPGHFILLGDKFFNWTLCNVNFQRN